MVSFAADTPLLWKCMHFAKDQSYIPTPAHLPLDEILERHAKGGVAASHQLGAAGNQGCRFPPGRVDPLLSEHARQIHVEAARLGAEPVLSA